MKSIAACLLTTVTLTLAAPDDSLQPDMGIVRAVTEQVRIDCCDGRTMAAALQDSTPPCTIARYLHNFVVWRSARDSTVQEVLDDTRARYRSLVDTTIYTIDTTVGTWVGSGPVTIVAYVSGNCGICKRVVGDLYDSVSTGSLGTCARLLARPFGTGLGERALMVALQRKRFWQLFSALRSIKERLNEGMLCRL
ncbi:MAG: hypothetical protein GF331_23780, partial [Chitinivibrionales bacterium]|nr:hypothetical protein [Chitinivibrionales bacterium]